jgi:hypothetical protein
VPSVCDGGRHAVLQITADITQSFYDSPASSLLLIPQGRRLIGTYDESAPSASVVCSSSRPG